MDNGVRCYRTKPILLGKYMYGLSMNTLRDMKKVKSMQRSGTEAIRTIQLVQIQREHGQPSEQLFPKRWPLSNRNRTKNNMNTHKGKRHKNSDPKTGNREPQQNYRLGTVNNELLGGGGLNMFYGANSF